MSDRQSTSIDRSLEDLVEILSARPADWVVPFLRIAAHAGEAAAGRSLGQSSPPGPRLVTVELGDPIEDDLDEVVVPLRWRTSGFRWVPTSFAGRVAIHRLSAGGSLVRMEGSYVLPDSTSGPAATHAASVAVEATIATFLRSLRAAAEEQARSIV